MASVLKKSWCADQMIRQEAPPLLAYAEKISPAPAFSSQYEKLCRLTRGLSMDISRCPTCSKRLVAKADPRSGRTVLACLFCDKIDPLQTDALKWANSPLGRMEDPIFPRPDHT